MPETEILLTGDALGQSLGEFSAQTAEEPEEMNVQPDWWHEAQGRAEYDSILVDEYLARLATESVSTETVQPPPAWVCIGYNGDSVVECLDIAGMDSSFEARAQLAVDHGIVDSVNEYAGSATQNIALLKALIGP